MTSLIVRRLLIDLEVPFERQWNGGDAFRTAFARFAAEVQGFIGQEVAPTH